ncbi:MAG: type II secretion system F family protein [Alphaproteobacteria bacterium]|nr:type II secretion system F family protein [Alphaproteobacteria bacterium]
MTPETMQMLAVIGAAVAAAAIAFTIAYPYMSGSYATEKRMSRVTENRGTRKARIVQVEESNNRKQAVAETLKELEARQAKNKTLSLRVKLLRAGLDISTKMFWMASIASGVLVTIASYLAMPTLPPVAFAIFGFIGFLGLPRWVVSFLTKRRQNKFVASFADAIDVIVRGVKSGLPLNECLGIIARESSEPLRSEFREVVDQQRVGVSLTEALDRLMNRMPLPEVRFFAIVIGIQQQAGGNLSEALGNLSGVLRARKMMAAKVQALSAEAKASAMVLGSLPPGVMIMVYLTTPKYISILWTDPFGNFLVVCAALWMCCGLFVMKKMISFKY